MSLKSTLFPRSSGACGRTRLPWSAARTGRGRLGLFDDHAAVECGLKLFGDDLFVADGAFLQDA